MLDRKYALNNRVCSTTRVYGRDIRPDMLIAMYVYVMYVLNLGQRIVQES